MAITAKQRHLSDDDTQLDAFEWEALRQWFAEVAGLIERLKSGKLPTAGTTAPSARMPPSQKRKAKR
jgi:hypothetical protein